MTDEEIEAMRSLPPTMPLLVAWKARAEAAEKRVTELVWQVNNMRNRAEAAEKERDEFRRALDRGPFASVEAQAEINHWRERAEAATMVERERCALIAERFWPEIMRGAWSKIEEARTAIRSGEEAKP